MIHTNSQNTKKAKTGGCSCGSAAHAPSSTCCDLVCFERPRYFCGHLLTDADLSKEQRYVIEKQKLYHRTLHGNGVVCGLRLTCDHNCKGNIVIGDGYAIDDCGQDLVVCESRSFDVIGALRQKGWLIESVPPDPCKPKEQQPECNVRQCFYVTICYQEEETDFTTPFIAGCRPSVTECEATRVREGVRFDLLSELPKKQGLLGDLPERIKACWSLFREGPFAKAIVDNSVNEKSTLTVALNGNAAPAEHQSYLNLFCLLRGYLLLYLNKHPDLYNCTIEEDIRNIIFPGKPGDTGHRPQTASSPGTAQNYGNEIKEAFCRLLELAYQHVAACIIGETIFPCHEPCEASSIVLGTVEVEHGRVVRVCNCPRDYVWSFASFFQTLVATIFGGFACEEDPHSKDHNDCEEETEHICCREFKLQNCEPFVRNLVANPRAAHLASTALPNAIPFLANSLRNAFDFTRTDILSPGLFMGMKEDEAQALIDERGFPGEIVDAPLHATVLPPHQAFIAAILNPEDHHFFLYRSEGRIVDARPELRPHAIFDPAEMQQIDNQFKDLRASTGEEVKKLREQLADKDEVSNLRTQLEARENEIVELKRQLDEQVKVHIPDILTRISKLERPPLAGPQGGGENGEEEAKTRGTGKGTRQREPKK